MIGKKRSIIAIYAVLMSVMSTTYAQESNTLDTQNAVNDLLSVFFTGERDIPNTINSTTNRYTTVSNRSIDDIEKSINNEQKELEKALYGYNRSTLEIRKLDTDKAFLEAQLGEIEGSKMALQKKIEALDTYRTRWEEVLKDLSKERSTLRSLARITKKEREELLIKDMIKSELRLQNGLDILFEWFLSDKTLGDILETERLQKMRLEEHNKRLEMIAFMSTGIEDEERKAALIHNRAEELLQSVAQEKLKMDELEVAKKEVQKRLSTDTDTLQMEIQRYRNEQQSAKNTLSKLQKERIQKQEQVRLEEDKKRLESEKEGINSTLTNTDNDSVFAPDGMDTDIAKTDAPLFTSPLKSELSVNAGFRDSSYQERFGMVHDGVDLRAEQGSEVLSIADGEVIEARDNGLGYSYIIVAHKNDMFSVYGHLSQILVKAGDYVSSGSVIARSGGTPGTRGAGFYTTGAHLHLELYDGTIPINPMDYLQ